jgi:hypothetical protein
LSTSFFLAFVVGTWRGLYVQQGIAMATRPVRCERQHARGRPAALNAAGNCIVFVTRQRV